MTTPRRTNAASSDPRPRLLRLAMPTIAALCEMRYLWRTPHALVNTRMAALAGAEPHTPFPQALHAALSRRRPTHAHDCSAWRCRPRLPSW